jgi:nucleoside-diphosphate-sugar epimerase
MRVLVTGSKGYVAQRTIEALSDRGHEVVGFDLELGGDVRHPDAVDDAARGCDAGIHCAVLHADSRPADILAVNVVGTYSFFAAAMKHKFRMAVLASSAPVHLPSREDDAVGFPLRSSDGADHVYDLSKALQKQIARDFFERQVPVKCLRLGRVVDGDRATTLGEEVTLSDLTYCRGGWVAIEDVAEAFTAALTSPPDDVFLPYTLVGSRLGRLRFNVCKTEARLGIRLKYDFAEFT